MDTHAENAKRIRQLNDTFRPTFTGGTVVLTSGVDALSLSVKAKVLQAVRSFDAFDTSNDPHHEHDFSGERCFFKLDYYSPDLRAGSEDPSDPKQTTRVLCSLSCSRRNTKHTHAYDLHRSLMRTPCFDDLVYIIKSRPIPRRLVLHHLVRGLCCEL